MIAVFLIQVAKPELLEASAVAMDDPSAKALPQTSSELSDFQAPRNVKAALAAMLRASMEKG